MVDSLEKRAENSGYRSKSEGILAGYLASMGIEFAYEDRICLENEEGLAKLFYPDFHLKKYGIVIEYLGLDNQEYLKLAEKKKKLYEEQGIDILQIKNDELWEQVDGRYKIREDFGQYLASKINEKISERGYKPIEFGNINSYLGSYYARAA